MNWHELQTNTSSCLRQDFEKPLRTRLGRQGSHSGWILATFGSCFPLAFLLSLRRQNGVIQTHLSPTHRADLAPFSAWLRPWSPKIWSSGARVVVMKVKTNLPPPPTSLQEQIHERGLAVGYFWASPSSITRHSVEWKAENGSMVALPGFR